MFVIVRDRASALAELATDSETRARVEAAISRAVRESLLEDARRRGDGALRRRLDVPRAEVKRRADMALSWLLRLRGDMGYSLRHALDVLPLALRAELDGLRDWEPPPPGRSWAATREGAGEGVRAAARGLGDALGGGGRGSDD